MSERITIFDTTLRDGEQTAGVCFSERDKIDIATALAAMRVDVIEAGFPAASVSERQAVAAVAREVRGASVCALARAVPYDIDAAAEAVKEAERPRIHTFVNASDVHLAHQLRKDREEVLGMIEFAVRRARNATDDVEFSPMDATRADEDFLVDAVRRALYAGATTINLPDTVGYVLPGDLARLVQNLRERVPELSEAGALLPRPGRSGTGHGERPGGDRRGGAAGGAGDQRHRRAGREHLLRRSRDGDPGARDRTRSPL